MAKRIIKLTETELNRIIRKVISEQTNRTGNLDYPEDFLPKSEPVSTPSKSFGVLQGDKNPAKTTGVLSNDLRKGSRGPSVAKFQKALSTQGYGTKPDGIFGPITQTAVMNFQQANGLNPSGRIDKETGDLILSMAHTVDTVDNLTNPLKKLGMQGGASGAVKKAIPPTNPVSPSTQKLGYGGGGGALTNLLRRG